MALQSRSVDDYKQDTLFWLSRAFNRSWNKPDWVTVNLTLRCNLTCSFCKTCYPVKGELSTREVKDIIDQVHLWGVRRFNPLGGEPFVRRDLEEILAYACNKDFYITMTTNGTLIHLDRAHKVARIPSNRLHFNISIDGPRELNDAVRGRGNFDKAVEGLRNIRAADKAAGNALRKININCIINNLNLERIPEFLFFCRDELGVQGVQFLNLFRHDQDAADANIVKQWIPDERLDELDEIIDFLVGFQEREATASFGLVNDIEDLINAKKYYRDQLQPLDGPCWAGWKELYINADGTAIMCDGKLDFLNGAFGDVRRQSLLEIWHSPELRERRKVVKNCTTPCVQDCYLRRRSDYAIKIFRGVSKLVYQELKKKYVRTSAPDGGIIGYSDSELSLQLTDVEDVHPRYSSIPQERFQSVIGESPQDFQAVRDDPFQFYEFRNRGYLNFNRGFMSFDVIKKLVGDAQRTRVPYGTVRVGWEGEPLLHPQMEEIERYLFDAWRETAYCGDILFETNGLLLNHNYCRMSMEYGDVPQTWLIHANGYGKDSYQAMHGEQLWDRLLDNVNFLLRELKEKQPERVKLILCWTVTEGMEAEAKEFVEFWTKWLADYDLEAKVATWGRPSGPGCWLWIRRPESNDTGELATIRASYAAALTAIGVDPKEGAPDETVRRTCSAYWKTPSISWDGKVLMCRVDTSHSLRLGAATDDDLSRIWWEDQQLLDIRKAVAREDFYKLSMCRDCKKPYSPDMVQIGKPELDTYYERFGR